MDNISSEFGKINLNENEDLDLDEFSENIKNKLSLDEDPFYYDTDFIIIEDDSIKCNECKYVLSIDVGILNLGMSVTIIDSEFNIQEITWVNLYDITKYTHDHFLDKKTCNLNHTKAIADWMEHLFIDKQDLFDNVDYILLERQPLSGLVAIEQLIYYKYRDKCHLISPRSMHCFFRINNNDYESRKIETIKIALDKYYWNPDAINIFNSFNRKHDISDSICLMAFWIHNQKEILKEKRKREYARNLVYRHSNLSMNDWFDLFKFKPINPSIYN